MKLYRILLALAAGLILTEAVAPARAGITQPDGGSITALNENIVQNPGAEQNAARGKNTQVKPKKWIVNGRASVRAYGGENPPRSESTRIHGGKNLFGALSGADSTARQRVNVTGQDEAIDRGELQVVFSVWLADAGTHPNPAAARLRFLNGGNKQVGQVRLPSVNNSDNLLVSHSATAPIPRGTRFFEVILSFGRGGDAFVDNVSAVMGLARPQPGAYSIVRTATGANVGNMLLFEMFPGSSTDAVVATRTGQLYRVRVDGSGSRDGFGDISGVMKAGIQAEEGLLGLAFSPDYATDRSVYLHYTAPPAVSGYSGRGTIARFRVANGKIDLGSRQVVIAIDDQYENHNGGDIHFGDDGYLYWSLGDGGSSGDPFGNGQNLGRLFGKILRLDVKNTSTYRIPADNPFVDRAGARPEIYAYGLRNMFRFSFDRETGELWGGDVGQNLYEEVDQVVKGGNYGWSTMEGFACFRPSSGCNTSGLKRPRAAYGRGDGCSVIGGVVSRGPSLPELNGWYVYGDYCTGKVWAVNTRNSTSPVQLMSTGLRITDISETANGDIVIVTFNNAVYRVVGR